jgi:type IV secretory pathway VirB3-like protein
MRNINYTEPHTVTSLVFTLTLIVIIAMCYIIFALFVMIPLWFIFSLFGETDGQKKSSIRSIRRT